MKLLVADASSLILLAKSGVLSVLVEVATVLVASSVHEEVCGPAHVHLYVDAALVQEMVAVGSISVLDVSVERELPVVLGRGERDAILLYFQEQADAVLTDDGRAIRACRLLGVNYIPSPRMVLELHREGKLPRSRARSALEKLSRFGRYSPDIISAAFERLADAGRGES